jgi:hypothetical protein
MGLWMKVQASLDRSTLVATVAAFVVGGTVGAGVLLWGDASAVTEAAPSRPAWTEVEWPFARDPWGRGKAFRCKAADCGSEVNVYVRAKLGFCNCTIGVADDEELERISDFEFAGGKVTAQRDGRPIDIAWMKGRSRPYSLGSNRRPEWSILSVGFNDRCDAIVATALVGRRNPDTLEPAVIQFLNSRTILGWAEVTLGL